MCSKKFNIVPGVFSIPQEGSIPAFPLPCHCGKENNKVVLQCHCEEQSDEAIQKTYSRCSQGTCDEQVTGTLRWRRRIIEYIGARYPQEQKENQYGLPRLPKRLPCNDRKTAFSLVELLMALLVASLLLAALAPVMTKKFHDNLNVSVSGNIVPNTYCIYSNDTTDTMLLDTEETGCIVPDNTYSASAIIASGGGGGGGAADIIKSNDIKTLITTINTTTSDLREEKTFDKYTRDMTVKITGAGGGGGGGNYSLTGKFAVESQADCEPFGIYVSSAQNGGKSICVSKYNPGENRAGSPGLVGVTVVPSRTACTNGNCCWYGNNNSNYRTGNNCTYGTNGGNYSGCSRTVCQWNAANNLCKNWKPVTGGQAGRLPKADEYKAWRDSGLMADSGGKPGVMNWNGTYGLQFCQEYESPGAPRCDRLEGYCPGAAAGIKGYADGCHPKDVWSADTYVENNTLYAERFDIETGRVWVTGLWATFAISVRCALDNTAVVNSQSGGGASSGVFAEIKVPDSVVILATKNGNGKVKTYAGAGGTGGNKESISKGTNGQRSFIEILDSNNTRIWSLRVQGGNAASGASKTEGGAAGSVTNALCDYFDITNKDYETEKTIECSKLPGIVNTHKGEAGISGKEDTNKGKGGKSYFNTAAGDYTSPGAGGSGSTCKPNEEWTDVDCSNGISGKGGAISVTYKTAYPGVGGGGGAAGTVLHIKNFPVRPKNLIKVKVGERGRGGSPGSNGSNGGNSYIELANSMKYEVLGGGGGYAGIQGNPNSNPILMPKPGEPGTPSGLNSDTKNKLSKNDEYFPKDNEQTIGTKGIESIDTIISEGGNGGINPKISPLVDSKEGTPCGGKSTTPVKINNDTEWSCNNQNNIPLSLSRTLSTTSLDKDTLTNLAPGSTGGGGGGFDITNTPTSSSGGASGLGGYVIIYFGEWSE